MKRLLGQNLDDPRSLNVSISIEGLCLSAALMDNVVAAMNKGEIFALRTPETMQVFYPQYLKSLFCNYRNLENKEFEVTAFEYGKREELENAIKVALVGNRTFVSKDELFKNKTIPTTLKELPSSI